MEREDSPEARRSGTDLTTVRDNLRHSSISMYLHTDDVKRAKQIGGAFGVTRS